MSFTIYAFRLLFWNVIVVWVLSLSVRDMVRAQFVYNKLYFFSLPHLFFLLDLVWTLWLCCWNVQRRCGVLFFIFLFCFCLYFFSRVNDELLRANSLSILYNAFWIIVYVCLIMCTMFSIDFFYLRCLFFDFYQPLIVLDLVCIVCRCSVSVLIFWLVLCNSI